MKETKEVKELRSKILILEMELSMVSKDIERFRAELVYNKIMLEKLIDNINFLQKNNVTVSINEFKKIKQQKKLAENRVKYYIQKLQPLEQIFSKKQEYCNKQMEKFEHIYRLQFENNILEFPYERQKKVQDNE